MRCENAMPAGLAGWWFFGNRIEAQSWYDDNHPAGLSIAREACRRRA